MSKDYYHILQVHEQAEQEVIEAAYKRLARKYHPDKDSSSGATAKMQELNEAYQVLKDPNKRADYDRGRRKSDTSQGKHQSQNNEQKSKNQERQSEEQAERERVEKRRREQDAKKEQDRKQEEKRKRDQERQENEEKVQKALREKNRRRLLIVGLSVGSVFVLVIALIGSALYRFISGGTATATNSVANAVNRSNVASNAARQTALTTRTVTVPSTQKWYDTGIEVQNGASVKIEYRSGEWTNLVGTNLVDGLGKQFDRRDLLLVPSSYLCALVAKIGNKSFHVGNSYSGTPGKGRLFLSMNDTNDGPGLYDDNGGSLTVYVEVVSSSVGQITPSPSSQPNSDRSSSGTRSNDLSDTYAIVGKVIYNKETNVVFTKPQEFFADAGKDSFNGLKYERRSSLPEGLQFVDGRKLTEADYQRLRGQ